MSLTMFVECKSQGSARWIETRQNMLVLSCHMQCPDNLWACVSGQVASGLLREQDTGEWQVGKCLLASKSLCRPCSRVVNAQDLSDRP
jgi:hypothetical protein